MNLFINAVSSNGKLILFDETRQFSGEQDISILLNESSKLIDVVDRFLSWLDIHVSDIKNIVVIHGPWSFTGIRSIVLFVNTLSFIYPELFLTPLCFFDMYSSYPIAKGSSKRDLFVKTWENAIIKIQKNEDFVSDFTGKKVYGDFDIDGIISHKEIDYNTLLQKVCFKQEKRIQPLYIKKPNIT